MCDVRKLKEMMRREGELKELEARLQREAHKIHDRELEVNARFVGFCGFVSERVFVCISQERLNEERNKFDEDLHQ